MSDEGEQSRYRRSVSADMAPHQHLMSGNAVQKTSASNPHTHTHDNLTNGRRLASGGPRGEKGGRASGAHNVTLHCSREGGGVCTNK